MSVQNIGSFFGNATTAASPAAQKQSSNSFATALANASGDSNSPEQAFMKYIKEPPAQRMIDNWLKAHGLTEQSLQQLPPQQREAIEKEMADDFKKKAEEKTNSKLTGVG